MIKRLYGKLIPMVFLLFVSKPFAQVTFSGPELLGRPTDHSITVNVVAEQALDAYFEYDTETGGGGDGYDYQTGIVSSIANEPIEVVIDGLQPNTRYYYRMVYSDDGGETWSERDEHSFHTQRAPGSTFTFTIIADSHLGQYGGQTADELALYERTLQNVAQDNPDIHIDLGDAFPMDPQPLGTGMTVAEADAAYFFQRPYLGAICHSIPFIFILGNHENEEGWNFDDVFTPPDQSLAIVGLQARKKYFPNPIPDGFYSGNENHLPQAIGGDTYREDYFAWEWGDVLFVVIEPYHYTMIWPSEGNAYGGEGQDGEPEGDRWDWSLGIEQYLWFKSTLENSNAKFKFVFSHHEAGGNSPYGRGGIISAPYFEWGGRNTDDSWGFDTERPASEGWILPIHQLMVAYGVDVYFHGHDHIYAYEELDGIVYLECPKPDDAGYDWQPYGYGYIEGHYPNAIQIQNSGHMRVDVSPESVNIDYVRSYLPGDGTNGEIAHTFIIPAIPSSPTFDLTMAVDPVNGGTTIPNTGVRTYPENLVVPIAATPATGYTFEYWSGDVADPNSAITSVTMDGDKTVTAHFATINTYDLTMVASLSDGGTTDPPVGTHTYNEDTVVPITATASTGYMFDYWSGDAADPNSASTTVMMDGNKSVTAHFTEFIPGYIKYIMDIGTGISKTSGTSLVINTTTAVEAGDAIIVGLATDPYQNLPVSITDASSNIYEQVAISVCYGHVRNYIFAAFNVNPLPAGSNIYITFGNSITAKAAVASVFRGLNHSDPIDQFLGNPVDGAQGQQSGSSAYVGPTGMTTQTAELLIGVLGTEGPVEDNPGTWDYYFVTGPRDGTSGGDDVSNITSSMGYRIVSATDAYIAQKSGITSRYWGATIATFKAGPLMYDAISSDYNGIDGFSASIAHPDGDYFTATATAGTVTSIHAYRIDDDANTGTTIDLGYFADPLRYWGVRIFGPNNPQYTVEYHYLGHPGITIESSLRLAARTDPWDDTWSVASETPVNHTITLIEQAGTEYTLASLIGDNSLPVQLTSFTAETGDAEITLKWVTESELNNLGFILERAIQEPENFQEIASYKNTDELKGQINSSTRTEYFYTDKNLVNGINYLYRLADVDMNGTKTYFKTIEATPNLLISEFKLHTNYPNPFNSSTVICWQLAIGSRVQLSIYDLAGREVAVLVNEHQQAGDHQIAFDASDLASGIYYYYLTAGGYHAVKKMVVLK
jgi:uncharacterized repeat protein (TIGR02543 family)